MEVTWTPQIVAAVLVFVGLLIFVHELGHFLAAKLFDIKVVKFSLGFGPKLVAFEKGDTTYQIAAIPLGGYVKMVGDNPHDDVSAEDEARSFSGAPVYQRGIVALAGPAFNLLFPVVCFFAYNVLEPEQQVAVVGTVEIGKPAQVAGLEPGDRIVGLDGERVWSFERMTELVRSRPGKTVPVEIERDGERLSLELTPDTIQSKDAFNKPIEHGQIGITSVAPASRIGVWDRSKSPADVRTGDRILSIDGQRVRESYGVDRQLRKAAGRTVEIRLARPDPHRAGGLVVAEMEVPRTIQVSVPAGLRSMEDLGWAPSGNFVRNVVPGGPADRAGLRSGDQIVSVAGRRIRLFWSFVQAVETQDGKPLEVVVARDGREHTLTLVADEVSCISDMTRKPAHIFDHGLGVGLGDTKEPTCGVVARRMQLDSHWAANLPALSEPVRLSLGEAFILSLEQTGMAIKTVGEIVLRFFTAEVSTDNLGGPISFFRFAAMAAERGVFVYLSWMAVLSVNLAFLNLLPIPILDGGHLLFCVIEAVKRKPVSLRVKEASMMVGMVLLLALFALAFRNDLANLGIF